MSWFLIALAAIALALFERFWAPFALKALHFKGSTDKAIAEPDETVVWTGRVENRSRLPIPFVRLMESFPLEIRAEEEPDWVQSHCSSGLTQWYAEEKLSLRPRQSISRRMKLSFPQRGLYRIGSSRISAGDLLGFRESAKNLPPEEIVIIPRRSRNMRAIQALGGFIGDISVRRFILEDPILTTGFRDYTGREPMKSISWTRSAMSGQLQVKEFDHTAEQHVMILLNTEGAGPEQLEECFRLTRSVCETLEQKKIAYGLRTNGNLPGPVGKIFHMAEGLGQRHLSTLLYALGRADGTCFYSFRYLATRSLMHRKTGESYIVITPPASEKSAAVLHLLRSAVGEGICVLEAREEVEGQ